jgi:DNA-binding PadR family transcriptional regulator
MTASPTQMQPVDEPAEPPPSQLSPTAAALLGLLAQREWTTYELTRLAQRSIRWFWKRAERKLYDEPKALVALGYAVAEVGATGKRPRTVYTITPAGREALRLWLSEEGHPPVFELENLIRVFFADQGDADQLRLTIARMARMSAQQRDELLEIAATRAVDDPMNRNRQPVNALTLQLVLALYQTVEEWASWAAEVTADWTSTTDPPWTGAEVFDRAIPSAPGTA